jgi:hypothetical protein
VADEDRLEHVIRLRLNQVQSAYVALCADRWDCTAVEALRRLIDDALDAEPTVPFSNVQISGSSDIPLRKVLATLRPTEEWVAERLTRGEEQG